MRSLEDHLSPQELVSLPESREILGRGGDEQQRLLQHLESCDSCGALANVRWTVKVLAGSTMASEENCPETDAWLEFAAGLRQDDSAEMLRHAACCGRCAADLKEALELLLPSQVDSATAPSGKPVEGLASASSEWQSVMAARIAAGASAIDQGLPHAASVSKAQWRWPKLSVWLAIPVATALAAIAILVLWRWVHPSDAHLLALAYNKQRILVLRIPGALPVPIASGTRGLTNGLAEPSELLELRLRTQKHLDQTPNSPYWHQILGEINLLEGDGESARRNLEIAQTSDDKLPNLKNDLAAAWFEMGDETGNAEDYAEAAELYSQQIHAQSANSSLLYFNRAICWERQNLNQQAEEDLRAALAAEPSPAWRKAIQAELSRLSAHSALPTDGYETDLNQATENLLPHWSGSSQDRATIARIAELGRQHHDRWLLDWIAAPHTRLTAEADLHLASSLSAADRGEARDSLDEARSAATLYRQRSNRPGLLRAQLAQVYALQRLGRATACIDLAGGIERQPSVGEYAFIAGQALLQAAICDSRVGALALVQSRLSGARSIADAARLSGLSINVRSMQADLLRLEGLSSAAWQADVDGLAACDMAACAPSIRYKFIYHMVRNAQLLSLPLTAAMLMHTAIDLASGSRDVVTRAYAVETLATLTGLTGEYDTSARNFAEAARIAHAADHSAMIGLYQAEWQVDQADVSNLAGRYRQAMTELGHSASTILASDYQPARIAYFNQLSTAQLALGQSSDALTSALAATHEAEKSLASITSVRDRQQWSRENAPIYWQLIRVYLRIGQDTAALQAWERYRSAPYRSAGLTLPHDSTSFPSSGTVIVLARVGDSYVGWLAAVRPLHALQTVLLGDSYHIERTVRTFYRLCADRNSRILDVSAVGSRLYSLLLQPFAGIPDSRVLWIDPDPGISMLPFAALPLGEGQWVGESKQVLLLPPWWSLDPSAALENQAIGNTSHFVAINGFAQDQAEESEVNRIASLFSSGTVINGRSESTDRILGAISSATIFHFSGHATGTSGARLFLSSAVTGTAPFLSPDAFVGIRLPQCRLAVLAACNTTAADPDQIEKLPDMRNALLLSGAHAVVASNWDVDDRSTNTIMLSFYHQLLNGSSPAEALRAAEQAARSSPAWQHPFYWAAFEVFTR